MVEALRFNHKIWDSLPVYVRLYVDAAISSKTQESYYRPPNIYVHVYEANKNWYKLLSNSVTFEYQTIFATID